MTRLEMLQQRVTTCRRRVKEAKERVQNMSDCPSAARFLEDAEEELFAAEDALNERARAICKALGQSTA